MNKIFRYYNQNRVRVWVIVIIIIFIITVIQIFNAFYRENSKNTNNISNQNNIEEEYVEESKSLVNGTEIKGDTKKEFGDLIDGFLKNCMDGQYDEAYETLSSDCKNELYPSKEIFIDKYCLAKFQEGKKYDFQLWSTNGKYIYLIKIYDDVLSSGRASNKRYMQDYYTVKEENEEYKLNISSYIDIINRNKRAEKDDIKIKVDYSKLYMDYEIYNLTIRNDSEQDIMLDNKQESNSIVLVDNTNNEYEALIYENLDEDLIIKANEEKEITIKFNDNYNEGVSNSDDYSNYIEINVAL